MLVATYFPRSVLVALSIWQCFQVNGSPHRSKSVKCERSSRPLLGAPVADLFALMSNSSEARKFHSSVFIKTPFWTPASVDVGGRKERARRRKKLLTFQTVSARM